MLDTLPDDVRIHVYSYLKSDDLRSMIIVNKDSAKPLNKLDNFSLENLDKYHPTGEQLLPIIKYAVRRRFFTDRDKVINCNADSKRSFRMQRHIAVLKHEEQRTQINMAKPKKKSRCSIM